MLRTHQGILCGEKSNPPAHSTFAYLNKTLPRKSMRWACVSPLETSVRHQTNEQLNLVSCSCNRASKPWHTTFTSFHHATKSSCNGRRENSRPVRAHLKIIQPLVDGTRLSVFEEVLAVILGIVNCNGWQVAVLQPKVLGHLNKHRTTLGLGNLHTSNPALKDRGIAVRHAQCIMKNKHAQCQLMFTAPNMLLSVGKATTRLSAALITLH